MVILIFVLATIENRFHDVNDVLDELRVYVRHDHLQKPRKERLHSNLGSDNTDLPLTGLT